MKDCGVGKRPRKLSADLTSADTVNMNYASWSHPTPARGRILARLSRSSERRGHYADYPEIVRELKDLLEKYKRGGRSTPSAPRPNDSPFPPHVGPGYGIAA